MRQQLIPLSPFYFLSQPQGKHRHQSQQPRHSTLGAGWATVTVRTVVMVSGGSSHLFAAFTTQKKSDFCVKIGFSTFCEFCGKEGIRTLEALLTLTRFPGGPVQPLLHLSVQKGLQIYVFFAVLRNIFLSRFSFLLKTNTLIKKNYHISAFGKLLFRQFRCAVFCLFHFKSIARRKP